MAQMAERLLGKSVDLISVGESLPLVVASYPRGRGRLALALRDVLSFTYSALPAAVKGSYAEVLSRAPTLVVADLRVRNACTCLGHHHPAPTHGDLSRRLAQDTGAAIGEIDLAVDSIRGWEPLPLAGLAVGGTNADEQARAKDARFQAALLGVFLHELEHGAFPERAEEEIRRRSDRFYVAAVSALLGDEFGLVSTAA